MIAEWRTSSLGELCKPVVGDVDPPRDPGVAPVGNMPEDPVEGADAAGSPDHPQVKADRHHLRRVRPLAMQPVEGIDHIGGEISETEILLAYGSVRFASKVGQLAGNHFLTIIEGVEHLPELGRLTLWQGAQPIEFTLI